MRYVKARLEEHNHTETYRFYMANSLFYSACGQRMSKRYDEILDDVLHPKPKQDADAIAMSIFNGAGLQFKR